MKKYSEYLAQFFPGEKIQKISVNIGCSCPNRDGTIGRGGCLYCDNSSFSPAYCMENASVTTQLEEGIKFFSRKYESMRYLAYFQSFTSTHGADVERFSRFCSEALSVEGVVGLVIASRPDTLSDDILSYLASLGAPVFIEIGAESASDATLTFVNRGHTWAQVEDAVNRSAAVGLRCGLHLIAGLPGEDDERVIENVRRACALPIDTLKLHQLQIIKGTPLHQLWMEGKIKVNPYSLDDYLRLCRRILEIVPTHIVIERFLAQAPPQMVVAPKWGIKNYQFMNMLLNEATSKHNLV